MLLVTERHFQELAAFLSFPLTCVSAAIFVADVAG